jgi:plastocyanin
MGEPTSSRAVATGAAAAVLIAIAGASATATAGSSAAGPEATAAATKVVEVGDDLYAPKRLKVASGTRVKWVWARGSRNRHDVYLDGRPAGAERFRSAPALTPFSFSRRLRKPGTYTILCTLHEGMNMRIDVTPRKGR